MSRKSSESFRRNTCSFSGFLLSCMLDSIKSLNKPSGATLISESFQFSPTPNTI
ncbi:hypothetical protein X975_10073, partial [Stegodyphus mimosarum]